MHAPFDIAADLDTPVSAFLKLAPLEPRFLLESVVGGEQLARYSFLGFGEGLDVRLEDGRFQIGADDAPVPDTPAGLLAAFRAALARAPRPGQGLALPFDGGLVGVAGFDLVRRLDRLPMLAPRAGGGLEAAYFAPRALLVFDHVSRRVALLFDGPESERAALRLEVVRLLRGPVPDTGGGGSFEASAPSFSESAFVAAVEASQRAIRAGDVYQLVLANRFSGQHSLDPFTVYRALRLLNPSPYMVFLRFGERAVVGSSPEALVTLRGRRATLRPIAGTRPRGADAEADRALADELRADPKEIAEHVMLVDLARNDIGRVALPGSVRVEPYRVVERYSHVMHLVSGVEGVLAPDHDAFDLYAACFPAGTVVGAPKVRALELIEQLEPVRRGLYAGTVGYFGHAGMDQAITIRSLFFDGDRYAYQAGAGLVADSRPEAEYREVMAKSAALAVSLELAREGL